MEKEKAERPSPEAMLVAAATDIHNDNCTLMARLNDPDFDPATGLDCTLNGALEHIMVLYERLLLFPQGYVPYGKVDFMVESTNALISAVERRYRLASAHKAGQAFRESLRWWHTDNEFHAMPQEAYKKHMIDSREGFIAALREFNCELFKASIPASPGDAPAAPPPEPAKKRRKRRAGTLRWRQKDAAAMLGISTRQLRSYKANPPDPYWPGWEDPVKLKTWFNAREGGARMAEAIKRHLPLREGGVTERGMAGSRLPARRT